MIITIVSKHNGPISVNPSQIAYMYEPDVGTVRIFFDHNQIDVLGTLEDITQRLNGFQL